MTEFVDQVNADRSAMDNYASRVDGLGAPGDMGHAQNALELVYELRSSAMNEIADKMSTALGDVGAEQGDAAIARQMQKLLGRRRPLRERSCGRKSTACSPTTGSKAATCRKASSSPTGPSGSKKSDVSSRARLGQRLDRSGHARRPRPRPERRQHQRHRTAAKERPAVAGRRNRRSRSRRSKTRANRPRTASTSRSRSTATDTRRARIEASAPAKRRPSTIPLTPAPRGEVTLEVKVDTVPGEQVSENNEASYTVVFE